MVTQFRASAPLGVSAPQLGRLADLPGMWMGSGFNPIFLPDKQNGLPFRVKLSATRETLMFAPISASIPNRGSSQDDIEFLGVHYLQRVTDPLNSARLFVERIPCSPNVELIF
jgi:hypothetical protein